MGLDFHVGAAHSQHASPREVMRNKSCALVSWRPRCEQARISPSYVPRSAREKDPRFARAPHAISRSHGSLWSPASPSIDSIDRHRSRTAIDRSWDPGITDPWILGSPSRGRGSGIPGPGPRDRFRSPSGPGPGPQLLRSVPCPGSARIPTRFRVDLASGMAIPDPPY
jgi:hypothetical protein